METVTKLGWKGWHFRSEALSRRVMGAVDSPLGQAGEGF